MTGIENSRWVAVSALAAAMFAVGFSFTAVACNNARDVSVAEAARAADSVSVPAPAASLGSIAKIVNAAPSASAAASEGKSEVEIKAASEGLKLKRFVVTHKIENREPVAGDEFSVSSAPIYAFAEFENNTRSSRSVRVLFENQDSKSTVGHVKLTVPGGSERFRTWGNTRMIRDPGHWVAVVSTSDGVELGRASFVVKG